MQCEVCPKDGDKGGIPVHAEGHLQVLEEFRLPPDFDPTTVRVFNTNTFLVRAEPLPGAPLVDVLRGREEGRRPARDPVRTFASGNHARTLPSTYLEVSREGLVRCFPSRISTSSRSAAPTSRWSHGRAEWWVRPSFPRPAPFADVRKAATPTRRSGKLATPSVGIAWPASVHFEIAPRVRHPARRAGARGHSRPTCARSWRAPPEHESVQQKEHRPEGCRLDRVWSYRANFRLPEFAEVTSRPR